jgi:hypothetical protein
MGILDIFKGKKGLQKESNTVLGQTQLGNQVIYGVSQQGKTAQQLLRAKQLRGGKLICQCLPAIQPSWLALA